jgi:hypothetical protein
VEECERLDELIRTGKRPAQLLTRAHKADVSETGDGWSDSRRRASWHAYGSRSHRAGEAAD